MADGIEIARAYVTIVPSMQGSQQTIAQELGASAGSAAKSVGEQSGKDFGNALATGLKTTAAVITGAMAAVTGAAVASAKAFIDTANSVATYGDTIDKESQKMNMSAEGYQEWSFILERNGASIESMTAAMKRLTTSAAEGDEAFAQLGITQEELASMTPEETWNRTILALQGVEDETTRTALATQLLGRGAMELGPTLNMTAEETEALRQQVHDLGGVMSDEAVKDAAAYADELTNMQTAMDGLKNNMMAKFLPGMTSVMEGLSLMFSGNGGIEQIQEGLTNIIGNIASLTPELLTLAQVLITSLLDAFTPQLPMLVSSIFGFISQALVTFTSMIPQLLPVITTGIQGVMSAVFSCLPLIIQSLISLISELVVWLSSGDNVETLVNGIVELVSILATSLADVLPILLPAVIDIISGVAVSLMSPENVQMILESVLYIVGAVVVALVNALPSIGGAIVNYFTNIKNLITTFGGTVKEKVSDLITAIKAKVLTWVNNLKQSFITAFTNIKTKISEITTNIKDMVTKIIEKIKELPDKVVTIGKNLVKGLWNGISDKVDWVIDRIKSMGSRITNAIKDVFGIASPSKVFAEIGGYLAQGLGMGFESEVDGVRADMVDNMNGLTTSMTANVTANGTSGAATVGNTTTYNGGNISINVYGAEGQDINALAKVIAIKLEEMTTRRGVVYG